MSVWTRISHPTHLSLDVNSRVRDSHSLEIFIEVNDTVAQRQLNIKCLLVTTQLAFILQRSDLTQKCVETTFDATREKSANSDRNKLADQCKRSKMKTERET